MILASRYPKYITECSCATLKSYYRVTRIISHYQALPGSHFPTTGPPPACTKWLRSKSSDALRPSAQTHSFCKSLLVALWRDAMAPKKGFVDPRVAFNRETRRSQHSVTRDVTLTQHLASSDAPRPSTREVNRTVATFAQRTSTKHARPLSKIYVPKPDLLAHRSMGPFPTHPTAVPFSEKRHASRPRTSHGKTLEQQRTATTNLSPMIRLTIRHGKAHVEVDRVAHKAWKRRLFASLGVGGYKNNVA